MNISRGPYCFAISYFRSLVRDDFFDFRLWDLGDERVLYRPYSVALASILVILTVSALDRPVFILIKGS